MKKSLLFLLICCLFCENAIAIDKKNLIIGEIGLAIFGISCYGKVLIIYNQFDQKYKKIKNLDFDGTFQKLEELQNGNPDENKKVVKEIYTKNIGTESKFNDTFDGFDFSDPHSNSNGSNRITVFIKEPLEKRKNFIKDYPPLNTKITIGCIGGAALVLGAYLNHKNNWF